MRTKFTLLLALLICLIGFSQPPVEWEKSFGGSSEEWTREIIQTTDGGYIVAGYTISNDGDVTNNHGQADYWIVKLFSTGEIEWQKALGGSDDEYATAIKQTPDEGFIIAGSSSSNDGDVTNNNGQADYWIVKTTSSGVIEWQKNYGGSADDNASSIELTTDGGYIVAGSSRSNNGDVTGNHGGRDYWIVKLTENGIIEWQNSYGGTSFDTVLSVQQTLEGGYILSGYTYSNDGDVTGNHGEDDYWILKLTPTGIIEWQKALGGTSSEFAYSIIQTTDGGYIVAGTSRSNDGDVTGNHGQEDYWVVKLTSSGLMEWQNSLGGSSTDWAFSIQQTLDGGYILAGDSYSNDGDVTGNHGKYDYWIVKLTENGVIDWQNSFGGSETDLARAIIQTINGGYVITGRSNSNDGDVTGNNGIYDYWVVKLESLLGIDDEEFEAKVFLYPNPNTGQFSLNFEGLGTIALITIVDVSGKTVYSETKTLSGSVSIDRNLTSGIYFVTATSGSSATTLKMIVE